VWLGMVQRVVILWRGGDKVVIGQVVSALQDCQSLQS